jgi:paraquat-inducible protein A
MVPNAHLTCRLCGLEHRPVNLAPGEKALCVRCDGVLAKGSWFGPDAALAFSITGLILAVPAALLPFISAGKFGNERVAVLFTGVAGLWDSGMRLLAVLVLLCGSLLPVALLATLAILHAPKRMVWAQDNAPLFQRTARILEHWAIPEVQVLAVLVALTKLGSVVEVTLGPGFWCYCAMAFFLLLAQHSFDFETSSTRPTPGRAAAGAAS